MGLQWSERMKAGLKEVRIGVLHGRPRRSITPGLVREVVFSFPVDSVLRNGNIGANAHVTRTAFTQAGSGTVQVCSGVLRCAQGLLTPVSIKLNN